MPEKTVQEVMEGFAPFEEKVPEEFRVTNPQIHTMQINVGYICNMACRHCHLSCGPNRTEVMSRETMQACLDAWDAGDFTSMDITGGAPEMNPDYEWFLEQVKARGIKPICRTNLTILLDPAYAKFVQIYADMEATVCASLPYFAARNCDKVRGDGTFNKSIEAMKLLNFAGIGSGKTTLMLVYNPSGAVLPPAQASMEQEYKEKLGAFGAQFDTLIAIANNPSGRFAEALNAKGNLEKYMNRLTGAFNQATCEGMMCRDQISIDYDGRIYDCDFNQALGIRAEGEPTVFDLASQKLGVRNVAFANHCYGCCAGAGSSCGGATA